MAKGKFNGQTKNATDTSTVALLDLSKMADTDKVTIVSESRADKTIIGIEKTPVVFDKDGKAEVTVKEAKYFLSIDGFELDEVEVEMSSDTENGGEGGADKSETPKNEQNAGGENASTGNEPPAGGDDSEKSEESKDDSENASNPDIEKTGAKKNAKGNK